VTVQQRQEDWSQRRQQQDLLHQLRRDWSLRQALQVDLRLEAALQRRVLLAVGAVAALVANSLQVLAVPAHPAAALLQQQDSWVPEHPDSCLRLPAALVPQAELVRAKPMRTRVNRDR
jgi:hypothetical protein